MRRLPRLNVVLAVLALASAGAGAGAGAAPAAAKPLGPAASAVIDRIAPTGIGGGITGVTVGISDPSLGTTVKSYGTATAGGRPLKPGMHYRIASVSKTFTALAVLQLVQQGKLSLHAHLCRYVPRIPNGCRMTIRQMLAMRAGIYDFTDDRRFAARHVLDPLLPRFTPARALSIIRAHRNEAEPPGKRTVHSNSNYVLLGYVIQKVTGASARHYVNSRVARLRLRHTVFPTSARIPAPSRVGTSARDRRRVVRPTLTSP